MSNFTPKPTPKTTSQPAERSPAISLTRQESETPGPSVKLGRATHDEAIMADFIEYDDETDPYDSDYDYLEHESERKESYDESWFYPICIGDRISVQVGDVFQDRYRISHRLGLGGFSIVWLAEDLKLHGAVALKILVAGEVGGEEYRMQEIITQVVDDTTHLLLCRVDDTFLLEGPNGNHTVLVSPVAGTDHRTLDLEYMVTTPLPRRMSAGKQLLETLESLHKAGIVHSDVSLSNVLWGINSDCKDLIKTLSTTHSNLGKPKRVRYETEWKENWPGWDGPERHLELVKPVRFPDSWLSDKVYLTDFGVSLRAGEELEDKTKGTTDFVSPERYHGRTPSPASDTWSFGVFFFHLYTDFLPFSGSFMQPSVFDRLEHMVEELGSFPAEWKGRFFSDPEHKAEWYGPGEKALTGGEQPFEKVLARARGSSSVEEGALREKTDKHALAIIKKVFTYLPEGRPTASQLLRDPDFKMLMELCEVQDGSPED